MQIDRCMTLFHESYREQSRRLLMLQITLAVLWCHTMIGARLQFEQTKNTCVYSHRLIVLTFSRATIGRVGTIPACDGSNYFRCFKQYKNPDQDVSCINGTYGHPFYLVYSWLTLGLPLAYLWPKSGKQERTAQVPSWA